METLALDLAHLKSEGFAVAKATAWSRSFALKINSIVDETLREGRLREVQPGFHTKGGVFRHLRHFHRFPQTRAFLESAQLSSLLGAIFPDAPVYLTHSKISVKFFGAEADWFPHQDNGYKVFAGGAPRAGYTFCLFLQNVGPAQAPIQVFPKSHLLGVLPHQKIAETEDSDYQLKVIPKIDIKPLAIEGEQGDLLVFHLDMIHQSGANSDRNTVRPILIFELEPFQGELEEGNRMPIVLNGQIGFRTRGRLWLNWAKVKAIRVLAKLARSTRSGMRLKKPA